MGHTDMRKGMQELALMVQQQRHRDPYGGDLLVFRGRIGSLVKIIWHDGLGMSFHSNAWRRALRLGLGAGRRRRPDQLAAACLLEGIDLRNPQYSWRPASAG